jgi:hypothetical protein
MIIGETLTCVLFALFAASGTSVVLFAGRPPESGRPSFFNFLYELALEARYWREGRKMATAARRLQWLLLESAFLPFCGRPGPDNSTGRTMKICGLDFDYRTARTQNALLDSDSGSCDHVERIATVATPLKIIASMIKLAIALVSREQQNFRYLKITLLNQHTI